MVHNCLSHCLQTLILTNHHFNYKEIKPDCCQGFGGNGEEMRFLSSAAAEAMSGKCIEECSIRVCFETGYFTHDLTFELPDGNYIIIEMSPKEFVRFRNLFTKETSVKMKTTTTGRK